MEFSYHFDDVPLRFSGKEVDVYAYGEATLYGRAYGDYVIESIRLNGVDGDLELTRAKDGLHPLWQALAPQIIRHRKLQLDSAYAEAQARPAGRGRGSHYRARNGGGCAS